MKKMLSILSLAIVVSMLIAGASVNTTATSEDPADTYVKQTAAAEDETLDMWFNHSFVKTARGDNVSTGKDTYSIYMAKNETESAQVVLGSQGGHKGLTVSLTDFTDGKGNTISSEVYRVFYVTIEGVNENNVLGGGVVRSDIDQPEVIMSASEQGAFDINAGMTQAFLLRANSTSDTPSGWYSAQFTVRQHPVTDGKIDLSTYEEVKTATVYAYVWDFEMPESSSYQTAVAISSSNYSTTSTNYKNYYDYLLDNRLCGFQVPGTLNGDNEYVHDPRVSAFCVTLANAYPSNSPLSKDQIANLYADFSSQEDWDVIKEKAYFYFDDEPMSLAQQQAIAQTQGKTTVSGKTVDTVKSSYATIASAWLEDPYIAVPFHENHPYPYDNTYGTTFMKDLYAQGADIKDAIQEMMDTGVVTLWVPKNNAFTPMSELKAIGYAGTGSDLIRNLDCSISGLIYRVANPNSTGVTDSYFYFGEGYFDWSQKYGEFSDRIQNYLTEANASGHSTKMWWYICGRAGGYTYANTLIENSGLQTKMYFWQSYQVGATGYLYYGSDCWTENGTAKTSMTETYYDAKTGEAKTSTVNYFMNRLYQNNGYVYGNGVLFYDNKVATPLYRAANGVTQNTRVAGTIRVDIMRDGIEDYEMLKMYESICGEDAAQAIVAKISDNVVRYASLAGFDLTAHGWDEGMTADDAVAAARIELGNAIEAELSSNEPDTPSTEAPETEAPATEAPATEAPATEAPATEAPATEAPATEAPATEAPETEAPAVTTGDVNGDGKVNATDILLIKRSMSGMLTLSDSQLAAADVNGDSKVNATDILLIKRSMAGMINLG